MLHKMVQSLMNIIRLVRVTLYFVFHIRHIMCMCVQGIWFRGKINVSNKKFYFSFFWKSSNWNISSSHQFSQSFTLLVILALFFAILDKITFWKIGRDGKLITLDHTLFYWFYYIMFYSFSVCGKNLILLLFNKNFLQLNMK